MRSHILIVLGVGIAARIAVWFSHGNSLFADFVLDARWVEDCRGVLSDPWFALAWDYARPPMLAVREIAKCAAADWITPWHFNILLVSVLDVVAAGLAFLSARALGVNSRLAVIMAAIWSVGLMAWEYYRFANSHNHIVVFLVTLVVFLALRRRQQPGIRSDAGFAAGGALLVSTYGAGLVLVPVLALISSSWVGGVRAAVSRFGIAVSLPALLFLGVALKNHGHVNVFSTSGYLSMNLAQYGFISFGYENQEKKLFTYVDRLDASPWWHWCFDRRRLDPTKSHRLLRGFNGLCLDFTNPDDLQIGLEAAEKLNDERFAKTLREDLKVAADRPWAMRFTGETLSSKTEALHNETGKQLFSMVLKSKPVGVVRTFLLANRSFFVWGPLMYDGVHHEPHLAKAPKWINWLATGLGILMVGAVVFGAVFVVVTGARVLSAVRNGGLGPAVSVHASDVLISGLLISFLAAGTVMNSVSCCENGRQFQCLSPIPFLLAVYFMNLAARRWGSGSRAAAG